MRDAQSSKSSIGYQAAKITVKESKSEQKCEHEKNTRSLLRSVRSRARINTLLERKQLLRPERLVMDLRSRLNEVLQVCPGQEVSEVHKFAVVGVLHVDDSPAGLAAADRLAVNDNVVLRADNSERNDLLRGDQ